MLPQFKFSFKSIKDIRILCASKDASLVYMLRMNGLIAFIVPFNCPFFLSLQSKFETQFCQERCKLQSSITVKFSSIFTLALKI